LDIHLNAWLLSFTDVGVVNETGPECVVQYLLPRQPRNRWWWWWCHYICNLFMKNEPSHLLLLGEWAVGTPDGRLFKYTVQSKSRC